MDFDYEKKFERDGLQFRMRVIRDQFAETPWERDDGHGVISEWTDRAKLPGERILSTDRDSHRFYDIAATLKIAKRDGWGIDPEKAKGLTKAQVTAVAVEDDFARMKAWCDDEWWWVFVMVELLDLNGNPIDIAACHDSLAGIESDDQDYHMEVAEEMADTIAAAFKGKNEVCIPIRKTAEGAI